MSIGGPSPDYGTYSPGSDKKKRNFSFNDIWQVALFNIVVAAKANGLRAIDCPYGDFNDDDGFFALAKSSYTLGFDGKMVIHPKQIKLANEIFAPSNKDFNDAVEMLEAIKKSTKNGKGAIAFKGKLLDIVTIKQAENIVNLYNKILEKKND